MSGIGRVVDRSGQLQQPHIPTDRYLDEALALTVAERRRIDTVVEHLPSRIADTHTHVARIEHVDRLADDLWWHTVSTFPWYSLEAAGTVRKALWPGLSVWSVRMPHAVQGYRHRLINRYLLTAAAGAGDVVGGYGLPDDIDYTVGLLSYGVAALKMYYRYCEPAAQSLRNVFPDPLLAAAVDLGVPVIAHLPRSLPDGLQDVVDMSHRFPSLCIVIAHAGGGGGQVYRDDLRPAFDALASMPTVYFDTALVWDVRLLETLMAMVGPDRVLFGTDEPLSLIRAVPYQHKQLGPRLYAPRYHWASDDGAPTEVTSTSPELLHLLQVEAVMQAVRPYGAAAVRAVFHDNAARLFVERTG